MTYLLNEVEQALESAKLVAWDGCHKIYVAMDELEAGWFIENYEATFSGTPEEMLDALGDWWESSCHLRFISAVKYGEFTQLVAQGAGQKDDDHWADEDFA